MRWQCSTHRSSLVLVIRVCPCVHRHVSQSKTLMRSMSEDLILVTPESLCTSAALASTSLTTESPIIRRVSCSVWLSDLLSVLLLLCGDTRLPEASSRVEQICSVIARLLFKGGFVASPCFHSCPLLCLAQHKSWKRRIWSEPAGHLANLQVLSFACYLSSNSFE